MVKKGVIKKLVAVSSLAVMLVSSSVMAYAKSNDRTIALGDSYMSSYIYAGGQSTYATLSTGVTSDMSISAKAIRKNFDGEETWQSYYGGADQDTYCSASAYRGDDVFMYAEATFRASSNDGAFNSDFINCSNY